MIQAMKKYVAGLIALTLVLAMVPAVQAATVNTVKVYRDGEYTLQGQDYSGTVAVSVNDAKSLGMDVSFDGDQTIRVRKGNKTLIMTPGTNQAQLITSSGVQIVNLGMVPYASGSSAYIPLQDISSLMKVAYQRQGDSVYIGKSSNSRPVVVPARQRTEIERYQVTRNNKEQAQLNLILDQKIKDLELTVKNTKLSQGYRVEIVLDDVKLSRSLAKQLEDQITIGKKQWFLNSIQAKNSAGGTKIVLNVDQKPVVRISHDRNTVSIVLKK